MACYRTLSITLLSGNILHRVSPPNYQAYKHMRLRHFGVFIPYDSLLRMKSLTTGSTENDPLSVFHSMTE
jgi:hypothetical protein